VVRIARDPEALAAVRQRLFVASDLEQDLRHANAESDLDGDRGGIAGIAAHLLEGSACLDELTANEELVATTPPGLVHHRRVTVPTNVSLRRGGVPPRPTR
jgi:hypothetical protein